MSSTIVNFLKVKNNVDFLRTFTIKSKEGEDAAVATDLTSATIFMQIKPSLGGEAVVSLSVGSGITKTDPANGKIRVLIDSAVMETVEPGKYNYDIVIVRSGISEIVCEGYMKVKSGATEL